MQNAQRVVKSSTVSGVPVVVYADVSLEQRVTAEPLADFEVGVNKVELLRVSKWGNDIIFELSKEEREHLENDIRDHSLQKFLHA
jgi:hypothetical protein